MELLQVPRMEDPSRKTATVAMKEPRKFGSLDQTLSNVLLYRSAQVTAIGSEGIRLVMMSR